MAKNAELWFESGESTLSVRQFQVDEAMSSPFRVELTAVSPDDNLDLEALAGRPAAFTLLGGAAGARSRRWTGVCAEIGLLKTDAEAALSTYRLVLVPALWLLTQRRNNRLYQHRSIPEIVGSLLDEWRIPHAFRIAAGDYPALELRVQYGESDYHFLARLLEEAGISYSFAHEEERGSVLILGDRPQDAEARPPLPFVDETFQAQAGDKEFVTKVRIEREVRPGRVVVRDYDFHRPDYPLRTDQRADRDDLLEQYHYLPNSFLKERGLPGQAASASGALVSGTPIADDRGVARYEDAFGAALAQRMLESHQTGRREVSFETSEIELAPGVCFSIADHPRRDLAGQKLLATACSLQGKIGTADPWLRSGRAVLADAPYRPARVTRKPRVYGLQGAVVVGPSNRRPEIPGSGAEAAAAAAAAAAAGPERVRTHGDDVYVDEHGRVRVQFPWDREGRFDEDSSMWMRVSQGWAGAGYGLFTIPRVGHEVLVAFLDGDPDAPLIVGRVHNAASQAPYKLAENKTVSTWRTESTPGGGGFNELRFDDAAGREHVYLQAQKDMDHLVKNDLQQAVGRDHVRYVQKNDVSAVGHNKREVVKHNQVEVTGLNRAQTVGLNRVSTVGVEDSTFVGSRWSVTVARGLTPLLGKKLSHLFEGTLAPVLEGAATAVLGVIPGGPLGGELRGAAQAALTGFKEASEGAFKNVLKVFEGFETMAGPTPTTIEVVDRRIELTTGEASIILDGPNITLRAEGNIVFHALKSASVLGEEEVAIAGREKVAVVSATDDIIVQAAKNVHLNPYQPGGAPAPALRLDHDFEGPAHVPGTCSVCGKTVTDEGFCPDIAQGIHDEAFAALENDES